MAINNKSDLSRTIKGTRISRVARKVEFRDLDLTLKFNEDNLDLLFHSKITPYNLRIGRAMSYHE